MRGVGCFMLREEAKKREEFPSPCGVWVVSHNEKRKQFELLVSVPLRGVGCFSLILCYEDALYPVSVPLRGVGCFKVIPITEADGPQVSVPLRGVGCFGKAAHSFWCNRKKNCQLCYFIVSYWQMFINSKLRNCKVPCEVHKTAT